MHTLDNILDKRFVDELYYDLLKSPWYVDNIAGRYTFPYGEKGTHVLMGNDIYLRENNYTAKTTPLTSKFISLFEHLCKSFNVDLYLKQISANLQFHGSDGTFHCDGNSDHQVFILMLCNEDLPKSPGGQFINKTQNKKVSFKHGRVFTFNAAEIHRADAFNKPYIPRISVKFCGEIVR
jgi:hypothetical protein|tara:strand:- start:2695 stop:3231 length:537 start_codon:yes stop_codon:yes gene_type:complete